MKPQETTAQMTQIKKMTKGNPIKKMIFSQKLAPFFFLTPFFLVFLIFFLYPIFELFRMSFQNILIGQTEWVGLANYKQMMNSHFYTAVKNTLIYTFWIIVILIPIPMALATLLNSKYLPFKNFFKSALFIPSLVSVIVGGVFFGLMFGDTEKDFINSLLVQIGFSPQQWKLGAATGMFLMVSLNCWRILGINVIYFLAGLQSIPNSLYEAADIDGANAVQKFFRITVPMLKPVTLFVLIISIFGGLRMFEESYVFWKNGSPNDIGLTIVGYVYQQAFDYNAMGLGAAVSVVLLLLALIIGMFQLKYFGAFKED
ncbi:sugar ABC transporter permease [Aquibacillus koreensis]|uniref:Sugar ABC transporter permease n=1 Tax=Aquibacillus koreensis TaxID=279446 RepID=A0A9X4AIP0_9BACI|nr:sugar ABC transporter permease [Aquibacillus koreensis]MCT2534799.1 sugar ABC transporter permease [Aquibacillus koreensis]MDC3419590.1 sugar ABC transporter permease [Aquibacillus koreensis]